MNTQKAALERAIDHWETDILEPLLNGDDVERCWFAADCALCQANNMDCVSCIITAYYGKPCTRTMWMRANRSLSAYKTARMFHYDGMSPISSYDEYRSRMDAISEVTSFVNFLKDIRNESRDEQESTEQRARRNSGYVGNLDNGEIRQRA